MSSQRTDGFALDRRGIALPLVLMLTVFLTISVGAGFVIAGNEHTVGVDHDAQLKAFAVAQEGVERYLTDVTSLPATFPDVRVITVPGGTDTVTMRQLRSGATPIFAITSVGVATATNLRRSAQTPVATRTISQFVLWQAGTFETKAAYLSLADVNIKNGASGSVDGFDAATCTPPAPAVPGLALPTGSFTGKNDFISGSTGNTPYPLGTPGPSGTAQDSAGVDWASVSGTLATDFTFNSSNNAQKTVFAADSTYANWPVVKIVGNLPSGWKTPTSGTPGYGQGILIVTGDADLSNIVWHGVVLVGGATSFSGGSVNVIGAMISGLNVQLGQTVGQSTMNGNLSVQYSSCDVSKALSDFGGWRRMANTWADNWPSYTVP